MLLREDPFNAPVHDENGNPIAAEVKSPMGKSVELNYRDRLGQYEHRPFG